MTARKRAPAKAPRTIATVDAAYKEKLLDAGKIASEEASNYGWCNAWKNIAARIKRETGLDFGIEMPKALVRMEVEFEVDGDAEGLGPYTESDEVRAFLEETHSGITIIDWHHRETEYQED